MKKTHALTVGLAISALLPAASQAIQLTDYTVVDSTFEEAFLLGQFNAHDGNQDQVSYNLTLEGDYEYNFTSQMRNWRLLADGIADVSRGGTDGDKSQENIIANATGNVDTYFNPQSKSFWFGSGELGYIDDADDMFIKVGGGLGYGRVVNATPLAKVLRFEEELREHGVITGQLSDTDYLALARIIDKESEFRSQYGADEYKPYWFTSLEEILKLAGVLKNGRLGAIGALHMDRVLFDEPISVRKHGWVVRAGVGVLVQDYAGNDGDPTLDFGWEYAMPYGYKSQLTNVFTYSTVLADDTDQILRNTLSYTYELSDRVDWENKWRAVFTIAGGDGNDVITNTLSSAYRYYITNRISADATVAISMVEDDIDNNGNDDTELTTFLGVRYRLK